jgi:hypothetical protein
MWRTYICLLNPSIGVDKDLTDSQEEDPAMDKKKKREYLRRFLSVSTMRKPDPKIAKVGDAACSNNSPPPPPPDLVHYAAPRPCSHIDRVLALFMCLAQCSLIR